MRSTVLLALAACAHAAAAPPPKGFARSKQQAAEVCLPPGEKAFIGSLRCADGTVPQTRRLGPVGSRMTPANPDDPRILLQMDPEVPIRPGEPDLHIVDAWEARCGALTSTVFVDMYHCPAPPQPPADGFTR